MIETPIKINRILLSAHERFFILSENIGSSETINNDCIPIKMSKILGSVIQRITKLGAVYKNTNPDQKIAFPGVGSPMNELVWRVSILNLANRSAENTVKIKGENTTIISLTE